MCFVGHLDSSSASLRLSLSGRADLGTGVHSSAATSRVVGTRARMPTDLCEHDSQGRSARQPRRCCLSRVRGPHILSIDVPDDWVPKPGERSITLTVRVGQGTGTDEYLCRVRPSTVRRAADNEYSDQPQCCRSDRTPREK